ncbi:MAG: (Fe-S)-binding protein [Dehalococcoidia bacterium]
MASKNSAWPRPDDAPETEDLTRCVHCGLCVNACPTYAITGLETESPRGRIAMARGIDEGRIPLTAGVQGHWDLCLQCRACEAVCPSGVPYGQIMEHARAQLDAAAPADRTQRRFRKVLLRQVVARPRVLAALLAPARMGANSPLRGLARRTGALRLLGRLGQAERQLPRKIARPFRPGGELARAREASSEAVVFTGCIMGEMFGDVHRATGRVLARCGVQGVATVGQGCCGALHAHDGDLDFARELARRNIDALESTGDRPIVVNSAGCGAAMKEYGQLLAKDTAYAAPAKTFAARVKDVTEFVAGLEVPAGTFAARVAYQDPCHLAHAQRIREAPRKLLGGLEGCELVETSGADMCCGAAGMYSLVQPEMSGQLRTRKAEQFAKHRPDVIATANPGCQMQYEAAVREAGIEARVMHVMEILDEATRKAGG